MSFHKGIIIHPFILSPREPRVKEKRVILLDTRLRAVISYRKYVTEDTS